MSRPCPGGGEPRFIDEREYDRIVCTGTAREYHLVAAHPHAFCGCGNESEACHPERCCEDDESGQCRHCGKDAPEPREHPTPEIELSDPLFEVAAHGPPA